MPLSPQAPCLMKTEFRVASCAFTALLVGTLWACGSPTQILNSWRDPNVTIQNPRLHKIVVAALLHDQGVRREVEDYMITLYPGVATQSYILFGSDSVITNEAAYNQKLEANGYDGIVLMKQVNMNATEQYVPGRFPAYYHTWGGYWGNGWSATYFDPGTPGHYRVERDWIVQVNVYALPRNELIWTANTRTTNPGGRIPLFRDVCDAVRAEMHSQGFLK
jgi:hypothetical protein